MKHVYRYCHGVVLFIFVMCVALVGCIPEAIELPCRVRIVVTDTATDISVNEATLRAVVSLIDNDSIDCGVIYGLSDALSAEKGTTKPTIGHGEYAVSVGDLKANTTYYYRAYAVDAGMHKYGKVLSFKTDFAVVTSEATEVTHASATVGGVVDSSDETLSCGVMFSTAEDKVQSATDCNIRSTTSKGEYSLMLADLKPATTYYYRAYAVIDDEYRYGEVRSFKTTLAVVTGEATDVTPTSARLNGVLEGSTGRTTCGFFYGTSETLDVNSWTKLTTSSVDDYYKDLTNLNANTTYYYCAFAIIGDEYKYGEVRSFKTGITITTLSASDVTATSATLKGWINSSNSQLPCGFIYGTSSELTAEVGKDVSTTANGDFTASISNLNSNITYYYRAYVIIDGEYRYGKILSFTTGYALTVTTSTASSVTYNSALIAGKVSGAGKSVTCGIIYGTTSSLTDTEGSRISTTANGNFTVSLTELKANTTYYYRAFAVTNGVYSYGKVLSFKTDSNVTVTTGFVSNITERSATMKLTVEGADKSMTCGILYGTTNDLSSSNGTKLSATTMGSATLNATGLQPGTTYYYRAYVVVNGAYRYGDVKSFTTVQGDVVTVITGGVTAITTDGATLSGTIVGASEILTCGFHFSADPDFSTGGGSMSTTSMGDFTRTLTGLLSGTTYYYKAFVDVNGEWIYGEVRSFTTKQDDVVDVPVGSYGTITVNGVSFNMIGVEGGTFMMGSSDSDSEANINEKPAHEVTLSSYAIGETEVTQALWLAVMGSNPSRFKGDLQRPVERVSWSDCQEFISKLNDLTGESFRLPTEAEWEFAARGGNASQGYKYSGSNTSSDVAWCLPNDGHTTHPVKSLTPNELGIYDMSGNVWEWCADWYGDYTSAHQTNPTGPSSGTLRTARGGSWAQDESFSRITYRHNETTSGGKWDSNGFRLVNSDIPLQVVTIATGQVSDITTDGATLSGVVTGANEAISCGIIYGTSSDMSLNSGRGETSSNGTYSINISDLQPNTTYYYCAYAIIGGTEQYGEVCSFTTEQNIIVTTNEASDITYGGARISGSVSGTDESVVRGFIFGLSPTLSSSDDMRKEIGTSYDFSLFMKTLSPGVTYYYRAYAVIDGEEKYGEIISFTTLQNVVNTSYETYTANGVSFKMISVEGGTFMMGSTDSDSNASDDEKPAHQVTLSSYAIGETEVTQELWQAVMGNNPSYYKEGGLQCPVDQVSWNDCQKFISKLNELTGGNFRLPTEAEWEFAARGGNASNGYMYSGSNTIYDVAWYIYTTSHETMPVKTKQSNELGIYDMSGNVEEWCSDWYGDYTSSAVINPVGPSSGTERVYRGGTGGDYESDCRVANRNSANFIKSTFLGFRLVNSDVPLQEVTIETGEASDITTDGATLNGVVTGADEAISCGIIYGTSSNMSLNENRQETSSNGTYTISISNLQAGITYYYCAYAVINGEEQYGEVRSFTTNQEDKSGSVGEPVDLGLSIKWASWNIGADSPEEYGRYFAWGETETKDSYTSDNSVTYGLSISELKSQGIIDTDGNLTAAYDAATIIWGDDWRMPTLDEIKELINECDWEWATISGVNGYEVTGPNGNSIFLPAAGYHQYESLYYAGSIGHYWSATPYSDSNPAYYLSFGSDYFYWDFSHRYCGLSVRPVYSETPLQVVTIATGEVSDITADGATLSGVLTGADEAISCGIIYGKYHDLPSTTPTELSTSSNGSYSIRVTGLNSNTPYYFRAYAIVNGEYIYGEMNTFSTSQEDKAGSVGEAVDLGLSIKWASWNVGADSPEEYGRYFAWGESETKSSYTESNSVTYGLSNSELESRGIIDADGNLTAAYDAATVNWGGDWRMPTMEELEELKYECTWEYITMNGVNGYKVIGPNGNSIFLPAAGLRFDTHISSGAGFEGYCPSATPYSNSNYFYSIHFYSEFPSSSEMDRYRGFTVRPVYSEAPKQMVTIATGEVTDITADGATLSGVVTGADEAISCGIIYGTSSTMSSLNNKRIGTVSDGTYSMSVSYLQSGTTYYYCAYAIIGGEEKYGEVRSFVTKKVIPEGAVDLGLSVYWATCNVGAESPEDYGDYFAWGETTTKSSYSSSNSVTYGLSVEELESRGIIDSDGNLTAAYDAATANWGSSWRMPTLDEMDELYSNCTWEWTTQSGVNGYKVTGPSGNSIFLPAAGYRSGTLLLGSNGLYWSATPDSNSYYACGLRFNSGGYGWYDGDRELGHTVRPVSE